MPDEWAQRVFLALVRRYDLKPCRYAGQERATVMVQAPKRFVDETLMPEFQALYESGRGHRARGGAGPPCRPGGRR